MVKVKRIILLAASLFLTSCDVLESYNATWTHFCRSFSISGHLSYDVTFRKAHEKNYFEKGGLDDGTILKTICQIYPRKATKEEVDEFCAKDETPLEEPYFYANFDHFEGGDSAYEMTIANSNVVVLLEYDGPLSTCRNYYWLSEDELCSMKQAAFQVAGYDPDADDSYSHSF